MPTNDLVFSALEFALEAAWAAGRITLGYFQTNVKIDHKADNSPVTAADRAAEQKIREMITESWPQHGIIGEEYGEEKGQMGLTWIIDPIDGTKSFIHGVPLYGVLLALVDGERPIIGVAHFPALNETIYAGCDEGCYWNGRRTHVSSVKNLQDAALLATSINMPADKTERFNRLVESTDIGRTWGDAYGYALVATGRADIMVDGVMHVWDCAPFQVIMEEAGGTFTDWQGKPTIYGGESIATNGLLFDQVIALTQASAEA